MAGNHAGAFWVEGTNTKLKIDYSSITGNVACQYQLGYSGGAFWVNTGAAVTISHSTISENYASRAGGLEIRGGEVKIVRTTIKDNNSPFQQSGNGFHTQATTTIYLVAVTMSDNIIFEGSSHSLIRINTDKMK